MAVINNFFIIAEIKNMKKLINLTLIFVFCATFCSFFLGSGTKKTGCAIQGEQPLLSIVIDDFGSFDQAGVETLISCKVPLTCAVLPNVDHTADNIELVKKFGHELILHMPMQSHVNLPESWYGPVYISNYDSPEVARKKLDDCFKEFAGVKGFNIHIGSGVSRNKTLMTEIYNYAKAHNLYFLDSRTIETPVVEDACADTGSIYLGRDVFLEADKNKSYSGVKFRLLQAAQIAKEKGFAIAIGHVGAEGGENTAKAIIDTLPELEKMNIKVVPLSEIYEQIKLKSTMLR